MKKVVRKVRRSLGKKKTGHKGWKKFLLSFFAILTPLFLLIFATWFVFGPIKESSAFLFCNNSSCAYNQVCGPFGCTKLACSPGAPCRNNQTRIVTAAAHTCGIDHGFSCVKNSCGATCASSSDCASNQTCSGCKCVTRPTCTGQGGSCYQLRCPNNLHEISGSCGTTSRPMTCCHR